MHLLKTEDASYIFKTIGSAYFKVYRIPTL